MIANVGPGASNVDETVATLRYADRAKQIKNAPTVNEDPKDTLLKAFQDEIEQLKRQLAEGGGGVGRGIGGGDEDDGEGESDEAGEGEDDGGSVVLSSYDS